MSVKYWLFLLIFIAIIELIMEAIKQGIKDKAVSGSEKWNNFYNSNFKKNCFYAFIALVPSFVFGFVLSKIDGESDLYNIISHSMTLYVLQYLCGMSVVAKLKEAIPNKIDKI